MVIDEIKMEKSLYLEIKNKCEKVFKGKYRIYDEDVIYDTMTSIILQYKKNSVNIRNFNAWIHGAIHFHYCTYLTNKNRNKVFTYENLIVEENSGYDTFPESKIDLDTVKKEIDALNYPNGEILDMRLFQGLSHREIAEKLDIKEATVRKHYSRSIKKLTAIFKIMSHFFILIYL